MASHEDVVNSILAVLKSTKDETDHVFTWKIPSITMDAKVRICHGYALRHCQGFIPPPILNLCASFYSNDTYTIGDIKKLREKDKQHHVYSHPFILHGQKWFFELWPNGCNSHTIGKVLLYICLASKPRSNLIASYTLSLRETNTAIDQTYTFCPHSDSNWYRHWGHYALKFEDIQHLETMTFDFRLRRLFRTDQLEDALLRSIDHDQLVINDEDDENGNDIDIKNEMKTQSFTWTVDDTESVNAILNAPNVYGFWSPIVSMHGFKWFLALYPDGSRIGRKGTCNLYLTLASVPRADIEVHVMATLTFYDHFDDVIFRHDLDSAGRAGSMLSVYSTEDLQRFDRFYFTAKITMIEAQGNADNEPWTGSIESEGVEVMEVESREFIWNLPPIQIEGPIMTEFEIFGLEWNAIMDEAGTFRLRLCWSEEMEIDLVAIRCFVEFEELKTRYTMKGIFDADHDERSWGNDRIHIDEYHALEKRTIKLQMDLIDVLKDGVNITEQYLLIDDQLNAIK